MPVPISLPGDLLGKVTFVTGPGKYSGKTTFMNRALALVRRSESPAFLTAGFDGERGDTLGGAAKPEIPVEPGDVFVTANAYLERSACLPEIVDTVPGVTALGTLCVARARRRGTVTLVGPEHNESIAWALERILGSGLARTALVDGAINRVTQAASFSGAQFVYVLRATESELEKAARKAALVWRLANLPAAAGAGDEGDDGTFGDDGVLAFEGPLTEESAGAIPAAVKAISVADFTKVFLDEGALAIFLRSRALYLRTRVRCAGIFAVLRAVSPGEEGKKRIEERFLGYAREASGAVSFNPYDARPTEERCGA